MTNSDTPIYVYPIGTEPYWAHRDCPKNTAGTHRGNLYCTTHGVRVAQQDAEQTAAGTLWHPAVKVRDVLRGEVAP